MTSGIETSAELARLEAALRDLIRLGLGSLWMDRAGFSAETIINIDRRLDEDRRRRRGVRLEGDRLEYTELPQLESIITRNWDVFNEAVGPKKYFELDLKRVGALRNVVAHTRQLLPFEEYLVAGISGQIRNQIAIYRSSMDETDQLWPSLESVTDSFGDVVRETGRWQSPTTTIRVGETVEFHCKATDPEGKQLTWALKSRASGTSVLGDDVTLRWIPNESEIGTETSVLIQLIGDRSHHRYDGASDAYVYFRYTVLPAAARCCDVS